MCCVDECVPKHSGAVFGHPALSGSVVAGLADRRIQTGESKQLRGARELVDVTNLSKYHFVVDVTENRNGHDDRIMELHGLYHLSLYAVPLTI